MARRWLVRAVVSVGVLAWLMLPVLGLVLLEQRDANAGFAAVEPAFVPVQAAPDTEVRQVGLALTWSQPAELTAPDWQGIADQVFAQVGDNVTHNTPVLSVDGIQRRAWNTPGAFFRPLSLRDKGKDVQWLNDSLKAIGLPYGTASEFTSQSAAGVKQFAASIGLAAPDGTFDPTWVIFLPATELVLKEVNVTVGQPAPSAGSALAVAQVTIQSAVLVEQETLDRAMNVIVGADGQGQTVTVTPELALDEEQTLAFEGTELALNEARDGLASEGMVALEAQVPPGTAGLTAQVSQPSSDDSVKVPTAAVFVSPDGAACVVAKTDSGSQAAVQVELIWDEFGFNVVRPLTAGGLTNVAVRVPVGSPEGGCG